MKKLILPILASSLLPWLSGCVERRVYVQPPPAALVVNEQPPAPQTEVYVPAPGPAYYWVPGRWAWEGRWVWMSGRWAPRPHPGAVWVGGRWTHRGHGYVWMEGHWR